MKFTDKFVLVPIERYNQLTKGRGKTKRETEEADTRDETIKIEGIPRVQGKTAPEGQDTLKLKKQTGTGKQHIKNKRQISITKKKTEIHRTQKIPPPPPGIPNRIKNIDFRWLKLF